MHLSFIASAPWDTVSGGYVYDRAIVDEARRSGHRVDIVEIHGRHPLPDERALRSAQAAWAEMSTQSAPVIDGLALPSLEPLTDALADRGAAALIHHPTALETGTESETRDRLLQIERAMFPKLRRILVTSDDTRRRLIDSFGVADERISVIIPGTADAARVTAPADSGMCRILSIGSIVPRKGHDVLLRALARLSDLDWHLTIVGPVRDAAYAASLSQLATELGIIERVTFAGELVGPELEALWISASIFALATYYEGFGMVLAEALRRGVPLAVTAGGAVEQIAAPDHAVIAAPGDVVSLSNGLRRLVYDVRLRAAMADAAWAYGQTLPGWKQQAESFIAALER